MADFDLIVIGAGAAGLSVAAGAAQLGARVALIERGRMGGDCLNTGCVPSKALLAAAHAARAVRQVGRFGVVAGEPSVDWDQLRTYVHGTIAAIAPMDSAPRYRGLGATVIAGEARFVAPDAVTVDGQRLTAKRFVVAAGSRAAVPSVDGLDAVSYWTNETLFDLPERPDHLLILGGGPVGLEMADAFAGLGCRVTLVEADRIAGDHDAELADGLRQALAAQGVTLHEGVPVARVKLGPRLAPMLGGVSEQALGPVLVLADGMPLAGSHLLVAAGRVPDLDALDLPAGNIRAGARGVTVDRGLRSVSNRRVFAAGDIADPEGVGPRGFTHVASYHAGLLLRRLLFRLPARLDYGALPRVIYTAPELAQTGLTESEANARGLSVQSLRWPMSDNDRAVAEGDTAGLVKLVVQGNRVLGAGILAPNAGEMINQWSLAIAQRTSLSALAGQIVAYPTRSEAGRRAASMGFASRLFAPRTKTLVRLLLRLP
jgi:pyruvate/2-oxoglutarate dehydrogenase complex dihydrolipoamide dehydrogenase (E3) component